MDFIAKILRGLDGTFYKMPGPFQVLNRWELLGFFHGRWLPAVTSARLLFLPRLLPVTVSLLTRPLWTWYLLGDDVEWQLSRKPEVSLAGFKSLTLALPVWLRSSSLASVLQILGAHPLHIPASQ